MSVLLANSKVEGFDWDEGNIGKNWQKHKAYYREAEEAFFGNPYFGENKEPSVIENRFLCIGKTRLGKLLFISFTMKNLKVRVISARIADKKEIKIYEKAKKTAKV